MPYKIIISDGTQNDIDDAIYWYTKIDEQLANRFVNEMYELFDIILNNPNLFRKRYRELKLVNFDTFPYQIIYKTTDS